MIGNTDEPDKSIDAIEGILNLIVAMEDEHAKGL